MDRRLLRLAAEAGCNISAKVLRLARVDGMTRAWHDFAKVASRQRCRWRQPHLCMYQLDNDCRHSHQSVEQGACELGAAREAAPASDNRLSSHRTLCIHVNVTNACLLAAACSRRHMANEVPSSSHLSYLTATKDWPGTTSATTSTKPPLGIDPSPPFYRPSYHVTRGRAASTARPPPAGRT
jgi:hypothetical protein